MFLKDFMYKVYTENTNMANNKYAFTKPKAFWK